MSRFSPSDAALEGFRISRERPRAILACSLFTLTINLLGIMLEVYMPPQARAAFDELQSQTPMAPDRLLEAVAVLSPQIILGLVVMCVMAAAVYRILLGRERGWLGYFRLGRAELRLMALVLILFVLLIFMMAGASLFVIIVSVLISPFGEGATFIMGTVAWVVALGVIVFVTVRMSLAPVITFERNRIAIADSWPMTRGHFWRLTGAYVLAMACIIVVALAAILVFLPVAAVTILITGGSLGDIPQIFSPPEPTWAANLEPIRLAYLCLSSVFTALWYAVIAAPGAFAYRALGGLVDPDA